MGAREMGAVCVMLGGGRLDLHTKIDPKAGVVLYKKVLSLLDFLPCTKVHILTHSCITKGGAECARCFTALLNYVFAAALLLYCFFADY